MSLESRYEALKTEIEAWFHKHVSHPEIGSIGHAYLVRESKPELDKIVSDFTAPEAKPAEPIDVFHVEPTEMVTPAPESFLPPSMD